MEKMQVTGQGYTVSLSSDGNIVAIGAHYNDGNGNKAGHVRIYEYSDIYWIQMGSDIDGENADNWFGWSVSLSSDGSIVAIGAKNNDDNGLWSGHGRVYEYSGGNWVQIGNDIDGEAAQDMSGWSVSLSSDGSIIAIGAPFNDGNGNSSGHVRVYENTSVGIIENTINTEVSIYPNPTTGLVVIKNEKLIIKNVEVFDIYGKEVYPKVKSQKTNIKSQKYELDLSKEAKGIYIIKVTTDKRVFVEKVVLE